MSRTLKKITSLFLLVAFLMPSVVKLEHHHENFICKTKKEKRFHVFHENCNICNFEFSIFTSTDEIIEPTKEETLVGYINNYCSAYYYNFSAFSFSLRAPPSLQA